MFDVLFDDREVLGMAGVGENRSRGADHHMCGVVAVIDLAIIELAEAVAQPPHARSDLAWHRSLARRQRAHVAHRLASKSGGFSALCMPSADEIARDVPAVDLAAVEVGEHRI